MYCLAGLFSAPELLPVLLKSLCQVLVFITLLSFPNMHTKVTGDSFSMKKKKVRVVVSSRVVPCVFVLVARRGRRPANIPGSWCSFQHLFPILAPSYCLYPPHHLQPLLVHYKTNAFNVLHLSSFCVQVLHSAEAKQRLQSHLSTSSSICPDFS